MAKEINVEEFKDMKKTMRTFWGAVLSFQTQIFTIYGTVEEVRSLLEETLCDIKGMDKDLQKIRESIKNETRI